MATYETARVVRARRARGLHGIYAIVNEGDRDPAIVVRAALAGGVGVVQYRAKGGIHAEHLRIVRAETQSAGALLIINDDWRAVIVFDCDGVHLGPDDSGYADIANVRAQLPDRIIGLSCGTVEEARRAAEADADYIGVGAVFATASKADAGDPIGLDGLRAVAAATRLPVAAIGGISAQNVREVRATGVAMAATISAIADARKPEIAARQLVRLWDDVRA